MIDTVAAFDGRIAKVQGPARSGKTEVLVRRCARLVTNGVAPESILVEVTSAFAAQAFRGRLVAALGAERRAAADAVCVSTALDACVRVLDQPEARAATGRVPRLLTTGEHIFLMEDMKTLGQPVRRLRKMLDYFYGQMAACEPQDAWIMGGEEETVLAHLVRTLTLHGAMLAQEAPALCADFLQSEQGTGARKRFAYVLCDDFQNLSHAEQTCLCLLADKQVVVCGNPNEVQATRGAHPCPDGFTRFDVARRDVQTFTLSGAYGHPDIISFADALCDHGDMDASCKAGRSLEAAAGAGGGVECIKWATPEDELDGVTKYLRTLLDAEPDLHENRTCVVVPNKRWAAMVAQVLRQRGFDVSAAAAQAGIGGDPRDSARSKALAAYTKLNLLADPRDLVAWRSWCGFDNHLTNSDAWIDLQAFAEHQGLSLYDALARTAELDDEPFLRAHVLVQRWRAGQDFIAAHAQRTGFGLLRAIDAEALPEFADIARAIVGDESAAFLYRLARSFATDPSFPDDAHVLHVAVPGTLCGTEYDNVFVIGAVDGFMPQRGAFEVISTEEERERCLNEDRKRFYATVAKAGKRLVVSHFSKADLELAERTNMQVARVRADGNARVAIVRPSCFLAEAGSACPGTAGGQAVLAAHGLA